MSFLICSLIDNAKPGSQFYIEIHDSNDKSLDGIKNSGLITSNTQGKIASYFAPRTDMQFFYYSTTTKREDELDIEIERMAIAKR